MRTHCIDVGNVAGHVLTQVNNFSSCEQKTKPIMELELIRKNI